MTHILGVLFCTFLVFAGAFPNQSSAFSTTPNMLVANCYDDDSQDIVNQDEIPIPPWPKRPKVPAPIDCQKGPSVAIEIKSNGVPRVVVNGKVVYESMSDQAMEVRVTPVGTVAIWTEMGSLYLYENQTLRTWLKAGVRGVQSFKIARNGTVMGIGTDGALLFEGGSPNTMRTVTSLHASRAGKIAALMSDGTIRSAIKGKEEVLYSQSTDLAVSVKVAANGVVVWRTESGKLGSTQNSTLYSGSADPVVSFKVNPQGRVAYLTQSGRLGRDGNLLSGGAAQIISYRIYQSGSVGAMDSEGRYQYFP